MRAAHFFTIIVGLLPCLIPPYAFRLSRTFGTKRVGWMVFAVFALLAALQLVRALVLLGWVTSPRLTLDVLYFVVPVMLLIGMVHLETLFRERLRLEQEERG